MDKNWIPDKMFGIPIDKCVHFVMFLPYPVISFFAFKGKNFWRTLYFVLFSGLIIVTIVELSQNILTVNRVTDPWDLVANIAAITLGSVIIALCKLLSGNKD
ncbi:MAG: VanZ family protein [Bacteroidales bacterium]|nr:VanZ family protein [Bacteroidales bacterium]MDD4670932.1 VanZ family protein [Bacteroidales bacterium]